MIAVLALLAIVVIAATTNAASEKSAPPKPAYQLVYAPPSAGPGPSIPAHLANVWPTVQEELARLDLVLGRLDRSLPTEWLRSINDQTAALLRARPGPGAPTADVAAYALRLRNWRQYLEGLA